MKSSDCFELILEGVRDDAEDSKERVAKALRGHAISRIFELDGIFDNGPLLVRRSADRRELETSFRELKRAGAQVLLVRSNADVKSISKRRAALTLIERELPKEKPASEGKFQDYLTGYLSSIGKALHGLRASEIGALAQVIATAKENGNRIFICGDASGAHLASLLTNDLITAVTAPFTVTCLNDEVEEQAPSVEDPGYEFAFVKQLKAELEQNDLVIGISARGKSNSVRRALDQANKQGARTVAIVGADAGNVRAQKHIYVPSGAGRGGYFEVTVRMLGHIVSGYLLERV
ncbi:MAG: SIS domain-containing protein [Bdellovibrionota bacterium]